MMMQNNSNNKPEKTKRIIAGSILFATLYSMNGSWRT
jgi:hypothetical protein